MRRTLSRVNKHATQCNGWSLTCTCTSRRSCISELDTIQLPAHSKFSSIFSFQFRINSLDSPLIQCDGIPGPTSPGGSQ